MLACLRKGQTFAELAVGFGVVPRQPGGTRRRPVALVAARAPKLRKGTRR